MKPKNLKLRTSARTVSVAAFLLTVAGCQFGPSDFFRGVDADDNGKLDLQEWMAYYGPHEHPWQRCSGKDFEPADCDGDHALSWEEYHSARFDNSFCGDSAPFAKLIYEKPVTDPNAGEYVLVSPCAIAAGQPSDTYLALSQAPPLECAP